MKAWMRYTARVKIEEIEMKSYFEKLIKCNLNTVTSKSYARNKNLCFWGCIRVPSSNHNPKGRK